MRTQLISAVQPPFLGGYSSDEYCEPPYWLAVGEYPGALTGNVTYEFLEEGEPATPGKVNSAMFSLRGRSLRCTTAPLGRPTRRQHLASSTTKL